MPNTYTQQHSRQAFRQDLRSMHGYTLPELMVSLAIIVILMTIGISSYQSITWSNRIANEINDLRSYIELGRSEALKRGLTVIICPSTDEKSCSNGETNWKTGWIVFATNNATAGGCTATDSTASGNILIKKRPAFNSSDTAVYNPTTSANNSLCFTRMGLLASAYSGWFSFNVASKDPAYNRCITLATSGRADIVRNGAVVLSGVNCS